MSNFQGMGSPGGELLDLVCMGFIRAPAKSCLHTQPELWSLSAASHTGFILESESFGLKNFL